MNDPYLANLAEQISRGSHKAFDEVFRQYYGRVSNFIRSLIKSQSVAEDIAQDVFVNLWNSRHALSEVRSLNSYIYTIARNAAIDHMRRIHTYNCRSNYRTNRRANSPTNSTSPSKRS